MKKIALFLLVSIGGVLGSAKSQDSVFARSVMCQLSSAEMYGRGYSFKGDSIAASYLSQLFAEMEVEPIGIDRYFQHFMFNTFVMEGDCELKIGKRVLEPGKDYYIAPFSIPLKDKKMRVIYADLKAIVQPGGLEMFCKENRRRLESSLVYINTANMELGDAEKEFLQKLKTKSNPFNSKGVVLGVESLPSATVAVQYDENIKKYSLINVIDSLFSAKPETIQINYSNELRLHTTQNVCAMISGSEVPDSIIIFSAHYDHVGTLGSKTYYPGAHDNASGTAAVMDIARYFSANPPKYSVAFLLFTAEEAGLLGSSYFVMNPLFSLKKVKMAINLDMFCGGDDGLMVVNSQAKETKPFFDRMKELNEANRYVKELKSRPNAPNSDHYFLSMHCPAIFIYTLGGRYGGYHNVYDTCEECGLENYQNIINLIIQSVVD